MLLLLLLLLFLLYLVIFHIEKFHIVTITMESQIHKLVVSVTARHDYNAAVIIVVVVFVAANVVVQVWRGRYPYSRPIEQRYGSDDS